MTFPLSPASPFSPFVTVIPSTVLNAWRTAINEAVDGTAGGTYTPSFTLVFNGQGIYADPFTGYVRSGFITIGSSGTFTTIAGASCTFNSAVGFTGNTQFSGTTNSVVAGTWGFYVDSYQVGSSTLHVGDASSGVGHILVDGTSAGAGSDVTFQGNGAALWKTGTSATFEGTAAVLWKTGTSATFQAGSTLTTDQPAYNADVGANNIKSLGVAKAQGFIQLDGSGGATIEDGYNIQSAAISSASLLITFKHTMANATYAVACTAVAKNGGLKGAVVFEPYAGRLNGSFRLMIYSLDDAAYVDFTSGGVQYSLSFSVFGRQ